jgi:hypothetical protein
MLLDYEFCIFFHVCCHYSCLNLFTSHTCRDLGTNSILQAIRDESMYDPRERIEMAQRQSLYRPSLLGLPKGDTKP